MQLKIEKGTFTNHSLEDIAKAIIFLSSKKNFINSSKFCLLLEKKLFSSK